MPVMVVLTDIFSPAASCASAVTCAVLVAFGCLRSNAFRLRTLLFCCDSMVLTSTLPFLCVNNKIERLTTRFFVEMAMGNEKRTGVINECVQYNPGYATTWWCQGKTRHGPSCFRYLNPGLCALCHVLAGFPAALPRGHWCSPIPVLHQIRIRLHALQLTCY